MKQEFLENFNWIVFEAMISFLIELWESFDGLRF